MARHGIMRKLPICIASILLATNFNLQAQVFSHTIKDKRVPMELITEALKGHSELVGGVIGDGLAKFVNDSISGKWNTEVISTILSSDDFRQHSTRIDTMYQMELEPDNQVKHYVVFRDVHYLGNNRFKSFRTCFTYYCTREEELRIIKRILTFAPKEIGNQIRWHRGSWE